MSTSTTTTKTSSKTAKKSKIITLRLSSSTLTRFPSDITPKPSLPPPTIKPSPSVQPSDTADKTSESNGTPMPLTAIDNTDNNSLAPPKVDRRRRGGAGVSGRKRAPPSIDPNGPIRERGRPGPKKKPRLPDGTIDHSQDALRKPLNGEASTTTAAHRLGPKANTGNINANLRALDRTGKPCRRWHRQPLQLKSFTGIAWGMASWKAPVRETNFPGDVKSDSTGSSEVKVNGSSAVGSERSQNGGMGGMEGVESSPAPVIVA